MKKTNKNKQKKSLKVSLSSLLNAFKIKAKGTKRKWLYLAIPLGLIALVSLLSYLNSQPHIVRGRDGGLYQAAGKLTYTASFGSMERPGLLSTAFNVDGYQFNITSKDNAKEANKIGRNKIERTTSDGTKYIQTVKETGIKEEIIINNPVEKIEFTANIYGLTPRRVKDLWYFMDENGVEKFHIPSPFMIDAKGERSDDVSITINKLSNQNSGLPSHSIIITPSQSWLNSPDRVFPVSIDPTFEVPEVAVKEDIDSRTVNSKTYKLARGERVFEAHVGHIHYQDETDNQYKDIDWQLQWDAEKKGWYFDTHSFNPFIPEYADDWVEFRDLFDGKDQTIKFKAVSEHVKGQLVGNIEGVTDENAVLYENAFGEGIDYIIYFTRSTLKKVVRIRDGHYPTSDTFFDFEVDFPEEKNVFQGETPQEINILGNPNESENLLVGDQGQTNVDWFTHLKPFIVWDSGENMKSDTLDYQFYQESGITYLRKTIPSTFFPNAQGDVFTDAATSYYMGAGDGFVSYNGSPDWDTAHDALTGTDADTTGSGPIVGVRDYDPNHSVWRSFVPVDTSALPDGVNVESATLYVYAESKGNTDNDGDDWISVVQTTQASPTTLVAADFDQAGAINNPIEGSFRRDITNEITASAYNGFVLNSTGLPWIKTTSSDPYTMLGLREGHDALDSEIASAANSRMIWYSSERAGTSEDPYFTVTYFAPEAHWKFDEGADNTCPGGTNDACDTTGAHDLAKTNATWQDESMCISGKCLYFDGTGDYLTRTDDDELDVGTAGSFTVSGWFRHGPIASAVDRLVVKVESGGGYNVYMDQNGYFTFSIDDDSSWTPDDWISSSKSSTTYDDNKWHHFSAVKNGTTGIYLYVDGNLIDSDENIAATGSLENTDNLYVGIGLDGSSEPWEGFLDELKFFDYARSSDEIKTDFIKDSSGRGSSAVFGDDDSWLSEGLVGYWDMEEATGSATVDRSGNGNDGTLTNMQETRIASSSSTTTTVVDTEGSLSSSDDAYNGMTLEITNGSCGNAAGEFREITDYTGSSNTITVGTAFASEPDGCGYIIKHQSSGKFGRSESFDGYNDYTTMGNMAGPQNSFTISTWINPTLLSLGMIATMYDDSGSDAYFQFYTNSNGSIQARIHQTRDSVRIGRVSGAGQISAGEWQHVMFTWNGGTSNNSIKIFKNGVQIDTTDDGNGTFTSPNSNSIHFWVGAQEVSSSPGEVFHGKIDEVRMYNRALDPSEVGSLYRWAPGPVAHYKLDEGTGTSTVSDSSGNNYTGTINGSMANSNWTNGKYGKGLNFDGNNDYISVSDTDNLDVNDYTISMWFKPDGTYLSTSDHVEGLIDKGPYKVFLDKSDGKIHTEVVHPGVKLGSNSWATSYNGSSNFIVDLAVYNGNLYAAQKGPNDAAGESEVFEYNGSSWSSIYDSNQRGMTALAVYNGKLYAGQTGQDSGDGKVYEYNGSSWSTSYTGGTYEECRSLAVYDGKLYAGMSYTGDVLVFDGSSWTTSYTGSQEAIDSLAVYDGNLYAGQGWAADDGDIYEFDGNGWSLFYDNGASAQTFSSLAVYEDSLFAGRGGAQDFADTFEYNGASWSISDDKFGLELSPTLTVYNGNLYSGSGSDPGEGHTRWYDGSSWQHSSTGMDSTESLSVYRGDLYVGTGNDAGDGDVFVMDNGNYLASTTTSWDESFHHISVTKSGTTFTLYVDGVEQSSDTLASSITDVNAKDLLIGRLYGTRGVGTGPGFFDGTLDDVRIYNYARTPAQVISDMNASHPAPGSPVGSAAVHYKFDEGYGDTTYDSGTGGNNGDLGDSGNSCPGTATECPSWTNSGKTGKALDFNNNGDHIDMGDTDALDGISEMTISLWVNPSSLGTSRTLVGKWRDWVGADSEFNFRLGLHSINSDEIQINVSSNKDTDSATRYATSNCDLSAGSWTNLIIVYDGNQSPPDRVKIYKNAVLKSGFVESGTIPTSLTSGSGDLVVGDTVDANLSLIGSLDELKIYNFALTEDQVKMEYNQGSAAVWGATSSNTSGSGSYDAASEYCPPGSTDSCTAPVGEWKFDEKTGTSAYDTSENNNIGTLTGGPAWKPQGACKKGACLEFDGSNDYVEINSVINDLTLSSAWTVQGWVNATQNSNDRSFFGFVDEDGSEQVSLKKDASTGDFKITSNGKTPGTGSALALNTWHNFALTWNGTDLSLYLNGVFDYSVTPSPAVTWASIDGARIGNSVWVGSESENFAGYIDNVRIYDYARTPAQIAWDYNHGKPIGHWKMDEGAGTSTSTVYDTSSNDNNGSLKLWGGGNIATSSARVSGKISDAINFDGEDDYVSLGSDSSIANIFDNGGTVTAWIKPATGGNNSRILDKSIPGWEFLINNEASFVYKINSCHTFSVQSGCWTTVDTQAPVGQWTHVAMVYNNSNVENDPTIYINGVSVPLTEGFDPQGTRTSDASSNLYIGARGATNNRWFDGTIDDVRIFNYALTQQQINVIYSQGAVRFGP